MSDLVRSGPVRPPVRSSPSDLVRSGPVRYFLSHAYCIPTITKDLITVSRVEPEPQESQRYALAEPERIPDPVPEPDLDPDPT